MKFGRVEGDTSNPFFESERSHGSEMHIYLLEGHGIYNLWESNTAVNFLKMATNLGRAKRKG